MLGPDVSNSGVMHARLVCELLDRCLDLPALLFEENKLDRDADVPKELQSVVNARAFPLTAPLDLKGLAEPVSCRWSRFGSPDTACTLRQQPPAPRTGP